MGGLFAASGPPVIRLFHRQPLGWDAINVTLVSFFIVMKHGGWS